jgi:hypothetical protein
VIAIGRREHLWTGDALCSDVQVERLTGKSHGGHPLKTELESLQVVMAIATYDLLPYIDVTKRTDKIWA